MTTARHAGTGEQFGLTEAEWWLLTLAEKPRPPAQLVEEARNQVGGDDVCWEAALRRLTERQLLIHKLEVPTGTDPLAELTGMLGRLELPPEKSANIMDQLLAFEEAASRFRNADLSGRRELLAQIERDFTALTGVAARRGQGRLYASRTLISELCQADYREFTLGGNLARQLTREVPEILERMRRFYRALYALHRKHGHYRTLYYFVAEATPGQVTLWDFFRIISAHGDSLAEELRSPSFIAEAQACWDALVLQGRSEPTIPELDVAGIREEILPPFFSPDLAIAASDLESLNQGRYLLIMGENHPALTLMSRTFWHCCPYQQEITSRVNARLSQHKRYAFPVDQVPERFVWPAEVDVIRIETGGAATGSECNVLSMAEVPMVLEDDEIRLSGPLREGYVEYFHNELLSRVLPLGTFKTLEFPVGDGGFTPRQELNGIVLQRATWLVSSEQLANANTDGSEARLDASFALFLRARRLIRRRGFPALSFVKPSAEYKPVLIDFDSFFLVELLYKFARRSRTLVFTEMLPGPDQLWVRDAAGAYTSEIRVGFERDPGECVSGGGNR